MSKSARGAKIGASTALLSLLVVLLGCQQSLTNTRDVKSQPLSQSRATPLVSSVYTADPSAHVFDGKLYIYASHDRETDVANNDNGAQFDMRDYQVIALDDSLQVVSNHTVLPLDDVPWAGRQLWAPDAVEKAGKYYLYFPAKDKNDIFRIGVAVADKPTGPFVAEPLPIDGSYSIDPAVYEEDGEYYLYFGGIWGGQLQNWLQNKYSENEWYPADDAPAITAKVAKLSENMKQLAEAPKDVMILDPDGQPIVQGDNHRRFFEAAWLHKYKDTYYFSYSTGDTHKIVYATGNSPYGPFTYQGVILMPVLGWTNHHSIVEFNGQWYLFFHDSSLSNGQTHLRSVKMLPLMHMPNGKIATIDAMVAQ